MNRVCIALVVAAMAFPALAQTPRNSATPGQVSQNTQEFVKKAAIGDMYEIQSSKMVIDRAQGGEFKAFAQKIVDDHTKSSNELKGIVQKMQGVEVPSQLDAKHKQMIDQLQAASGARLERQYKDQQISAHNEAISLFESYSKDGDNAELKSFAQKTLPALKQHLQMAQNLRDPAPGTAQMQNRQSGQATQGQSGSQGQMAAIQVISSPGPQHIMGSNLRGTSVYGANNEEIGEIDELVLNRDGQVVAVVVGVGGFLGIGEKNVAVPFNALDIQMQAQTTGTGVGYGTGMLPTNRDQTDRTAGRNQPATAATGNRASTAQTRTITTNPQKVVLRGMTKQDLEKAPAFNADGNRTEDKERDPRR